MDIIPAQKRPVGRPAGKQNEASRVMAREKAYTNLLIAKRAKKLVESQTIVAIGTHHMITIRFDDDGTRHTEIVRDDKRQEKLLTEGVYGKDYLIIEGTPADWRAGDALLNRAFGKPKETLEIDGEVGFTLRALNQVVPTQVLKVTGPEESFDK